MFTTPGHAELRADIVTIVLGGPLAGMPQIAALEFARDEIHRTVHEELAAQGRWSMRCPSPVRACPASGLRLRGINEAFVQADVALAIAANDVVTPVAPTDKTRTICGMPILNADRTQNVIVIRRGKGAGHSGIGNALFFEDICRLCMARRGV